MDVIKAPALRRIYVVFRLSDGTVTRVPFDVENHFTLYPKLPVELKAIILEHAVKATNDRVAMLHADPLSPRGFRIIQEPRPALMAVDNITRQQLESIGLYKRLQVKSSHDFIYLKDARASLMFRGQLLPGSLLSKALMYPDALSSVKNLSMSVLNLENIPAFMDLMSCVNDCDKIVLHGQRFPPTIPIFHSNLDFRFETGQLANRTGKDVGKEEASRIQKEWRGGADFVFGQPGSAVTGDEAFVQMRHFITHPAEEDYIMHLREVVSIAAQVYAGFPRELHVSIRYH